MGEHRLAVFLVVFFSVVLFPKESHARVFQRLRQRFQARAWQPVPQHGYPQGYGGYTPHPYAPAVHTDEEYDGHFTWSGRSGHELVALLRNHLQFLGGEHATFNLRGACSGYQPWTGTNVAFNIDAHGNLRIGWNSFTVSHGADGWVTLSRRVAGHWSGHTWVAGTWEEHHFRDVGSGHGAPVLEYQRRNSAGHRVDCRLDRVHDGEHSTPIVQYFARLPQENEFQRRARLFGAWSAPSLQEFLGWAGRHPTPLASNAFVVPLSCRNPSQGFQHDTRHLAPDFRLVVVNVNGQLFVRLLKDPSSITWGHVSSQIAPLTQTSDGLVATLAPASWSQSNIRLTVRANGGNFIVRWSDGQTGPGGQRIANYCSDTIAPGTTPVTVPAAVAGVPPVASVPAVGPLPGVGTVPPVGSVPAGAPVSAVGSESTLGSSSGIGSAPVPAAVASAP